MDTDHVTVIYKWTAKPGKLDELVSIYKAVTDAMEQNEPDAEAVHVYISEEDNALYVRDEFGDAGRSGPGPNLTEIGLRLPKAAIARSLEIGPGIMPS